MGDPENLYVTTQKIRIFGLKVIVYGMKGDSLWETPENLYVTTQKIRIFGLKVIVYGMKGDNCIEKR